jgi:hypothetical protein
MRGTPTKESTGRGLIRSLVFAGDVLVVSYRPQIRLRTCLPLVRTAGMATDTAATKQPSNTTEESAAAFALSFGY